MSSHSASLRLVRPVAISLGVWVIVEAFLVLAPRTHSPWIFHAAALLLLAAIVFAIDRSTQESAQAQLRLQATALTSAANGIVITNRQGAIEWVNPAFTRITGFSLDEAKGKNPRLLKSGSQDESFYRQMWTTISSGKVWQGEILNRRKDGTLYTEEMTITPVLSSRGEITHFVAIKNDVTARKYAEDALQRAEEEYRGIFEEAIIGIFRCTPDADGRFLMINPAMRTMLGLSDHGSDELAGSIADFYDDLSQRKKLVAELEEKRMMRNVERLFRRKDKTEVWLSLNLRCVFQDNGAVAYYEGTAEDITERKTLERQLEQAQKLESVGRLAGGVAHDFNNMLGIIGGYSELLKLNNSLDKESLHKIDQIHLASKKAAALTQQLLAFSRKQVLQPRHLDLDDVVTRLSGMLRRLLGADIELVLRLSSSNVRVNVDPSQIDQVLMNLSVNARDAMPVGGALTIETDECDLDATYAMSHKPVIPGRYVRLSVTDTGTGIDKNTLSHIFEPFFTTKELGKGTGLGLSIVYGIVKQSQGYIWVYSEPGQGTTFKIYFPLHSKASQSATTPSTPENIGGSETLLVVEDEELFRSVETTYLRKLGYRVLEAENGEQALAIAMTANPPVQLLMTDLIMPRMGGRELADRLLLRFPNLKVLYTSGYTHDGAFHARVFKDTEAFLQKPFALSDLSTRLRELLREPGDRAAQAAGGNP